MRLTDGGIWHATPIPVLASFVVVAESAGLLGGEGVVNVLDAGAGDGRVLAALATGLGPRSHSRIYGLECDASLAAAAASNLEALERRGLFAGARRPRVAQGDYFDPGAYACLGLTPRQLDVVFNYPDGNERRLLDWLRAHARPGLRLLILSPDREFALGPAPLIRAPVMPLPGGPPIPWQLVAYQVV